MTIAIRSGDLGDSDAIWDMLKPVFRAGQTYAIAPTIGRKDALAYWQFGRYFLAEIDGVAMGTFYIHENRPGGGAHYCNCGFVTAPDAQGRGVARAMLEYALAHATDLGFEGMVFNFVVASNTRAVALWQRYGFDIVGRVPSAFRPIGSQESADALVMFKSLP